MLIVATDHLRKVEHYVSMSVEILHLRLIEWVAYIHLIIGLASLLTSWIPSDDEASVVSSIHIGVSSSVTCPA